MRHTLVLVLSVLALVGCETVREPIPALDDTSWSLPLPKGADCEALPYLEFSANRFTGDFGCNRFSGEYQLDGNHIEFHNLASTRKSCDSKTMQVERRMLEVIEHSKMLRRKDDTLCFLDKEGNILMMMVPETLGACH